MSSKIEQFSRPQVLALASLVLGIWLLYLRTMSPAFPANDSPETVAAAFQLGIQHPPGYPLPALLGRLVILGLPLGSEVWRVNLLSAALALGCGLLAVGIAAEFGARPWACLGALPALGLWRVCWEQATEAKGGIYLLNLALCFAMLWCGLRATKTAGRLWGLLAGLALANHYLSALLYILPTAYALWYRRSLNLWAALPGLSLYAVLMIRAGFDPGLNYGDPRGLEGLSWLLLRKGYTQSGLFGRLDILADQLRLWALHSISHGAGAVLLLGAWGGWLLWKSDRARAALVFASYGAVFASAILINRTEADVRWLADIFVLPAQALLAATLPLGLGAVSNGMRADAAGEAAYLVRPYLLMGLLGAAHFRALDRSGDFTALDFGRNLLASLPKGALYLAEGDYHYMPLLFDQAVRGRRRDAVPLVTPLLREGWYRRQQSRRLRMEIPASAGVLLQGAACFSTFHPGIDEAALAPLSARQRGLVRELDAGDGRLSSQCLVLREDTRAKTEPLTRNLMPWYAVALVNEGNELSGEGDFAGAARAYERALAIPAELPREGIGSNLAMARQRGAALARPALMEADRLAQAGSQKAIPLYRRAMDLGGESAVIWRNIGVLEYQGGRRREAVQAMEKALELAPGDKELMEYLRLLKNTP